MTLGCFNAYRSIVTVAIRVLCVRIITVALWAVYDRQAQAGCFCLTQIGHAFLLLPYFIKWKGAVYICMHV